ncbi:UDP-3-O-acyl-N-acetylglucosamine deacetylase [Thermodesulfobacteriota bacterium]
MDYRQRTIRNRVNCTGIGLHSGHKVSLAIEPAPPDSGIKFIRKDLSGHPEIQATYKNVVDTNLSTTIGYNGFKISTVEHLMAAFFGLGIDNVRVALDGPEVPIMDGSSAPFIFLIKSAGIKEQRQPKNFIVIKKAFKVRDGNRSIHIQPAKELKINYTIDFDHPLLKDQKYVLHFSGKDFVKEISRARTFGFLKDINILRENGLAQGGSLDNAIVIDEFRVINEGGLRYDDEFVRHKILDFVGDLAILGSPVIGDFVIEKSGHFLNQYMLNQIINKQKYWKNLTFANREECSRNNVKIPVFGLPEPVAA